MNGSEPWHDAQCVVSVAPGCVGVNALDVAENIAHGNRPNSYAQAIGMVNALCDPRDRVIAAAGGLPAEVTANWRTLDIGTVDVEFGFSGMGYEIAGGWGASLVVCISTHFLNIEEK